MNWKFPSVREILFPKKSKDVIPNPRDSKRKRKAFLAAQENTLKVVQFLAFALALLILISVS